MVSTRPTDPTFREGDEVVLAKGSYQGTLGIFLHLKGGHPGTQWRHPQPPGDLAGSLCGSDPRFCEVTPCEI
jgi:hypothetical protein